MHEKNTSCDSKELECANAATPYLLSSGKLILVWTAGGAVSFASSTDLGKTWGPRIQIADHQKYLDTGGDARAQVVADDLGHVMVAYGYFKDSHWNAKINWAVSSDGGLHFSTPKALIKQGESERFPVMGLDLQGAIHLAWVDKRVVAQKNKSARAALGASVAYTSTRDWGESFQAENIVNAETCECCRIGLALDDQNRTALVYRAIFAGGVRDHGVQWIDGLGNVQGVHKLPSDHWVTDVCPHQGPSLAISASKVLHATWFTMGEKRSGLFYARSRDQGVSFSEPIKIGRSEFNPSRAYALAKGSSVWLVWKEFDGQQSKIMMQKSIDDGESWSEAIQLASTRGYSDHPLLVMVKNEMYLSWFTRLDGYHLMALGE